MRMAWCNKIALCEEGFVPGRLDSKMVLHEEAFGVSLVWCEKRLFAEGFVRRA